MPRKPLKELNSKSERIEVRLSSDLKQALESYSIRNLESIVETTNRAIKAFVGFGEQNASDPVLSNEDDLPKKERLEIRVHPQLKKMILDAKTKISAKSNTLKPSISAIILSAIIQYIDYQAKSNSTR
jgi:hypothetical protein